MSLSRHLRPANKSHINIVSVQSSQNDLDIQKQFSKKASAADVSAKNQSILQKHVRVQRNTKTNIDVKKLMLSDDKVSKIQSRKSRNISTFPSDVDMSYNLHANLTYDPKSSHSRKLVSKQTNLIQKSRGMMPVYIIKHNKKIRQSNKIKQREKRSYERELLDRYSPLNQRFEATMNVVPTDVLPNYVKQHFVNSRADQVQRTVRAQIHQKTVHDLTGPKLLEIMN